MKLFRQLQKIFIEPYESLQAPQDRLRSEILVWFVLLRQITLVGLAIYYVKQNAQNIDGLLIAVATNALFYFAARSRYFKIATVLMILQALVAISHVTIHSLTGAPDIYLGLPPAMMAPPWFAIGPVIACLVLPLSWSLGIILATSAAFAVIYANVDPHYQTTIAIELGYTIGISCFAFFGAVLRDRSDKAFETERARVLQSAKLASLGEMASGVAHELNTPLNAIMLNIEITQGMAADETTKPSDFKDYLTEIDEISQRMTRIIRGMKDFSRDAATADFELIQPKIWIEDALRLCQQRFKSSSVQLELIPNDLLLEVHSVQPTQLSQVLLNLLNNAFDAVRDQQEPWVRIRTRVRNGFFELSVEDSGPGISEEIAAKLFQPFFTTKEYGHGTGLGLSISKGIARRHGGDLFLNHEVRGTCFVLRLPQSQSKKSLKAA